MGRRDRSAKPVPQCRAEGVIAASRRRCRLYRRVAFLQHEKPPVYARGLALIRDAGCDADVLLDLSIRK